MLASMMKIHISHAKLQQKAIKMKHIHAQCFFPWMWSRLKMIYRHEISFLINTGDHSA